MVEPRRDAATGQVFVAGLHTLRRTVGTLVAHSVGLDAARDVLGHRDPSVTARHYIADIGRVVDVRDTLDPIFA